MGLGAVLDRGKQARSSQFSLLRRGHVLQVKSTVTDNDHHRFARAELKHLIVALIGRYEFTLSRDASTYYPAGIVTSKPAKGMWVKMKRVEGW